MKTLAIILAIFTTYANKTFHTECAVDVNAPSSVSDTILARFIHDFQTSPDALFDWAFYGVGTQDDDSHNTFLLDYKQTEYFPEREYGRIVTDVVLSTGLRFRDITLEGRVTDERQPVTYHPHLQADSLTIATMCPWVRHMYIDGAYSGKLLEHGFGNLYIVAVDSTHSVFFMDINLRYGWFFNLFITRRVYANSVEWRVNRYMNNLKRVAEAYYRDGIFPSLQPAERLPDKKEREASAERGY